MAESEFDESRLEEQPPITPSMVTIRDRISSDLSVFPPINHEGLHISSHYQPTTHHQPPKSPDSSSSLWHSSSSSSSSSFSCSTSISVDSDESDGFGDTFLPPDSNKKCRLASVLPQDCITPSPLVEARTPISSFGWLGFGLEILRRKWSSTSSITGLGAFAAAIRSYPLMRTMAAVYVASLVLKWVRLRRSRQCKINTLMGVIREQDEKIVKLLDQIARLNEVLLDRQRCH